MAERPTHTLNGEEGRPLRCARCHKQIGQLFGPEPDPDLVVLRCMSCAAVEEAESILAATEAGAGGEDA